MRSPTWRPRVWHPVTLGMNLRRDGWDYVEFRLKFALRVPEGHVLTEDYRGLGASRWILLLPFLTIRRRQQAGWWAAAMWAIGIMRNGWPPLEQEA